MNYNNKPRTVDKMTMDQFSEMTDATNPRLIKLFAYGAPLDESLCNVKILPHVLHYRKQIVYTQLMSN